MSFIAELIASFTAEVAGSAIEGPTGRFLDRVRRRVTLPLVGAAWVGGLAAMVGAWFVGVGSGTDLGRGAATVVFIFALIPALVLTRFWIGPRGA
jgi:hypothetical protein